MNYQKWQKKAICFVAMTGYTEERMRQKCSIFGIFPTFQKLILAATVFHGKQQAAVFQEFVSVGIRRHRALPVLAHLLLIKKTKPYFYELLS
jgi:hypothetical protein